MTARAFARRKVLENRFGCRNRAVGAKEIERRRLIQPALEEQVVSDRLEAVASAQRLVERIAVGAAGLEEIRLRRYDVDDLHGGAEWVEPPEALAALGQELQDGQPPSELRAVHGPHGGNANSCRARGDVRDADSSSFPIRPFARPRCRRAHR